VLFTCLQQAGELKDRQRRYYKRFINLLQEKSVVQDKQLVKSIDHCSLIVANTHKALEFYKGILALQVDESRPDLGYPGAWLQVGKGQIHLLEIANPDSTKNRPEMEAGITMLLCRF
jgi:hypothetical protein